MNKIIYIFLLTFSTLSFADFSEQKIVSHFFDEADQKLSDLSKLKPQKLTSDDLRSYLKDLHLSAINIYFTVTKNSKMTKTESALLLKEMQMRYETNINGLMNSYDASTLK